MMLRSSSARSGYWMRLLTGIATLATLATASAHRAPQKPGRTQDNKRANNTKLTRQQARRSCEESGAPPWQQQLPRLPASAAVFDLGSALPAPRTACASRARAAAAPRGVANKQLDELERGEHSLDTWHALRGST